jgi:hypothetical protein
MAETLSALTHSATQRLLAMIALLTPAANHRKRIAQ